MRVLSFIPAVLIAAASFVAAAPTALPTCVPPTDATPTSVAVPTDTGVASTPTSVPVAPAAPVPAAPAPAPGNDAPLGPIISIIVNATAEISPLSDQLHNCQGDSSGPSVDVVTGILVQITAVVSATVVQLQAAAEVDITGLDLTNLCATIYALLTLILTILNTLVVIITTLGVSAVATLQVCIGNLLTACVGLVVCLKVYVSASITGVLGPVMGLVCSVLDLLSNIVLGVSVIATVN